MLCNSFLGFSLKVKKDCKGGICTQLYLLLILLCLADTITVKQSHFVTTPICINQESIDNNCVVFEAITSTVMDCALMCIANDSCVGASINTKDECYHHKQCSVSETCDLMDANFTHLVKTETNRPCLNGGKWHFGIGRCLCEGGWVNQYCHVRAQTCDDLILDGYQRTYHHVTLDIHKDESELIEVYCIVNPKKAYALVLANNGSGDFNRSWDQYVSGFGDTHHNTWLGLHNLYLLNQVGYTSVSIRVIFENFTESKYRRSYDDFVLKDSSENYKFTVGKTNSHSGPSDGLLGCLIPLENSAFSTWDRDNDGDSGSNCAAINGAGWWYPNCNFTCNLVGYISANPTEELPGIDGATMASHFSYLEIYASE